MSVGLLSQESNQRLSTDGYIHSSDMIFIGPNDLAMCLLGYTPASNEKVFLDAQDTIVAAAKEAGKLVGTLVNNGQLAQKEKERFDFV